MAFLGPSCAMATNVQPTEHGITIPIDEASQSSAGTVRLTVMTDNIIRVEAASGKELPQARKSLIIVPQAHTGKYTWNERGDSIDLTTRTLKVSISRTTGGIVFRDRQSGRVLLREAASGGKTFTKYVSPQTTLPEGYRPSAPGEVNWGKRKTTHGLHVARPL